MFLQVVGEVVNRFNVGVHTFFLRIGDEDDAINTPQNEFTAGVVEDLARDGVQVEPGLKSANGAKIEWKEVEEEGAVGFGGKRDHLALLLLVGLIKDVLQIGR